MTPNREDYLKLILELGGNQIKISNKQIVAGLGVSAASVSEMISKLEKEDLVKHTPYQGVQLTHAGAQKASDLMRRHRLWEVFLVEHLHYSWNDVHDDAEVLEHVTSDELANKLEAYLGFPEYCPHGGKIPQQSAVINEQKRQTLNDYPLGAKVKIARVLDEKELLDYLVSLDLKLQEVYEIVEIADYEGPITIQNETKKIAISYKAASTIFVDLVE